MSTPEDPSGNPFDNTIWDPVDPERAIEDPLHGPSAVHDMLEIPEMPLGDGTYYQPGGFYAVGTVYFDAKGQPVYRIGSARGMSSVMREMRDLEEWRETSRLGEDALTALEAQRQRARLSSRGVAHAFKPSDVCGGGKRLDQCDTAITMMQAAQEAASSTERPKAPGEGRMWNTLAWLGRSCADCSLSCEVAIETNNGEPTGITRFSNTRPLAADFPVIRIDLSDK
ncbi:MAG TPA: hypothetical protein VJ836_05835 [Candidatus Saccharimonadales bacterium]|nr:hypothetical protein [Candidatus Saccharimonadales bacterium]